LISFPSLLSGLLITACVFSLARFFLGVRDYPFPVYWSEGNRLWDYSILFGRSRYTYPAEKVIPVSIDLGRQILWGAPFVFSNLPIWAARLWGALVSTLPYALLGWAAFASSKTHKLVWVGLGLWAYLFLAQAAIYTPLIVSALLVVLAWRSRYPAAVVLTAFAGVFAYISRTTWMAAPLLWIGMLEWVSPVQQGAFRNKTAAAWQRALELCAVALIGGVIAPASYMMLFRDALAHVNTLLGVTLYAALLLGLCYAAYALWLRFNPQGKLRFTLLLSGAGVALAAAGGVFLYVLRKHAAAAASQPLLWSRLLPNTTYGQGILIALALAAAPLLLLLAYLLWRRGWVLSRWQQALILLPLLAFLGLGLVASVKIGGGSNLHNLDMFFVDLLLVAALAWRALAFSRDAAPGGDVRAAPGTAGEPGAERAADTTAALDRLGWQAWGVRLLLVFMVVLPAWEPVNAISPLQLVSKVEADKALQRVRAEVSLASQRGDVLFMDHRQLLTFNYVKQVPLLPEYEKKIVMDYAMAGDAAYFEKFYADLQQHRFALIISDPLKVSYARNRQEDTGFGEENDAWVRWVAEPVLRYYAPLEQFKGIGLQLLVPR